VLVDIDAKRVSLAERTQRKTELEQKVAKLRAQQEDEVRRAADAQLKATADGAALFARIEKAEALVARRRQAVEAARQTAEQWQNRIMQLRAARQQQREAHADAVRHNCWRVERLAQAGRLLVAHFEALARLGARPPPQAPLRDGAAVRALCDAALATIRKHRVR
jgi:chromosome segregation ATPase